MSIHDVVLFVSSTSQVCVPPVQFVRENKLPARLVRLDTVADRQAAAQGKYFQVHIVPTLLVTYDDGNIQLFAGQEKVLMWLQQAIQARQTHSDPHTSGGGGVNPDPSHVTTLIDDSDEDDYEKKPRRRKKDPPRGKPRRKPKGSKKTKSPPKESGGLYGGKPRRKKKPPVQFNENSGSEGSDDEGDIVFIDDGTRPQRPPPPPTAGLMVGAASQTKRKSQMTGLYDIAKQMEKDRQGTLGYRDEDLPAGT